MSYWKYLGLVFPLVLSSITVPLLGAVDTALVGHFPKPAYISGVAIGAVIFSSLYWLFGFLRISTTSFTAQALEDENALQAALIRPLSIAISLGLFFIVFQTLIFDLFIKVTSPEVDVINVAKDYFSILIWGAPFTLINYVLLGFLMGRARMKWVLYLQLLTNGLNILISVCLVHFFQWKVEGVAVGTLIAQVISTFVGVKLVFEILPGTLTSEKIYTFLDLKALKSVMLVNRDLMIRTICLLIVTNLFLAESSAQGIDFLAANSILFQVQYIISYFYDGFANAGSILSGRAKGARDFELYQKTVGYIIISYFFLTLFLVVAWFCLKSQILGLFTDQNNILFLAIKYAHWLTVFPIIVGPGLLIYGVFCGISYTQSIRDSMILGVLIWLVSAYVFIPVFGNNGIWLSFILFCLGRSLLILWLPKSYSIVFSKNH